MSSNLTKMQAALTLLSLLFISALSACGGGGSSSSSSSSSSSYYQISGTISPAENLDFDSDVNDEAADYSANDTISQAQEIDNAVVLSGYVNVAASGELGRSYSVGDVSDYYLVDLESGQQVGLSFDSATANLDLYLYDDSETLVETSQGTGDSESLSVSAAGTYSVEVRAESGAALYSLTVAESGSISTGPLEMHLNDSFVPGDIIVRFNDKSRTGDFSATTLTTSGLEQSAAQLGLQGHSGAPGRAMRMGFSNASERDQAFSQLGLEGSNIVHSMAVQTDEQSDKLATIKIVQALRQREDVAGADLNYYRSLSAIPNDIHYTSQSWHYDLINLPSAWDLITDAGSVIIAVVDTGVLLGHPDLDSRLGDGYDFISSTRLAGDGDGIDSDPDDPGDQSNSDGSSSFHGTHISGIIAAESNDVQGVSGVTWSGGELMPLRVLGLGGFGTSYDIMQALRYAAGLSNDSGTTPAQTADIINLSLGGSSYSQSEQDLYSELHNAGIIVVASAGNDGDSVDYPAAYADVVAVSAVDENAELATYSNFGAEVDVAAPGGDASYSVYSTLGDDSGTSISYTYGGYSGTSMATPHVVGVAALVKSEYSALTASDFDALLKGGELTGLSTRSDEFGYGLIDAFQAVNWAVNGRVVPTVMMTDPETLSFDDDTTISEIEVYLYGADDGEEVTVFSDEDWLGASADSVDADGIGTYAVAVDINGMSRGDYSATLTFTSSNADIPDAQVPVTLELSETTWIIDGGLFHVQLCDSDSGDALYETTGRLDSGELEFSLNDVAVGTYRLIAGTDSDNDGTVDEADEIGGRYQATISVSRNLSSLDFEVAKIID